MAVSRHGKAVFFIIPTSDLSLQTIQFTGINKGESGPMLRASFEETVEVRALIIFSSVQ